jgi:hypothetical protein
LNVYYYRFGTVDDVDKALLFTQSRDLKSKKRGSSRLVLGKRAKTTTKKNRLEGKENKIDDND